MLTHTRSFAASAPPVEKRSTRVGRRWRRLVAVLLTLSLLFTMSYAAVSIYIATQLAYRPPLPIDRTPAALGLQYRDVTFPSREDNIQLRGWFIPGILPNGSLTAQRTIIFVHGFPSNRADKGPGLLDLSGEFAHHGFAVLAFDMRGLGESPPAPLSLGYFEQRDVLGAVDFLRSGPIPYPNLGRPHVIGGWGVSMGGATLILAAAHEPAIRAIVSDCAYANALTRLERDVPIQGHLPSMFTPGGLLAARALYGVDFYDVRPVDVIAQIAPRPIFLIHGADDNDTHKDTPPSDMYTLAAAALSAPHANVQTWLVPGVRHAQSFHVMGQVYVDRVVAFFTAALGPDTSGS